MKGLFISTALLLSGSAFASYSAKVVGGDDAGNDHSWMAGLHEYLPDTAQYAVYPFCGGSLIAPGWVVTAAHCLEDGISAEQVLLRIDQPALTNSSDYIEPGYSASALVLHENYTDVFNGFDIALVKLTSKLDTPTISIADDALVNTLEHTPFTNNAVRVLGWGIFDNENFDPASPGLGDHPDTLQSLVLDYLPTSRLSGSRPDNIVAAHEPHPGNDQPFGADTCYGDSGGPLMLNEGNSLLGESTGGPILVGITSYGSTDCNSTSSPGIYTRVSAYTRWIEQQTVAHGDALADLAIGLSHPTRDLQTGSTSDDVVVTITNQSHETHVASFDLYADFSKAGLYAMPGTDTGLSCAGSFTKPTCRSTVSLDAGESLSYRFSVTDQTGLVRSATIFASITARYRDDYRLFNNSTSLTLQYANGADLSVSLDKVSSSTGEFTVNVRNLSDLFTATDTLVNLDITPATPLTPPPGCTRFDDIRIQCALGDLAPEQVFSRTLRLTRKPGGGASLYDLDVSVSHTGADPKTANNSDSYPFFSPPLDVPRLSSGGSSGGAAAFLLCLLLWPGLRRLGQWR